MSVRLVLASASPARLATLRAAGLNPEVLVSGVDEASIRDGDPQRLCSRLATAKAYAVAEQLSGEAWVIGCDSVLELDGDALGKPGAPTVAVQRWRRMRGRSGTLHTGHCVLHKRGGGRDATESALTRVASTIVHFAMVSDAEIEAYVFTGEPIDVAGGFTLDGLGGAFVSSVEGDPSNVVGISLPLLREMLGELDLDWLAVWPHPGAPGCG